MPATPAKNAVRATLFVALLACVGAGFRFGGAPVFWIVAAALAAGLVFLEIRLRGRAAAERSRACQEPDGRDEATRVVVPWRSSPYWDEFDLEVGGAQTSEWYCFYGHAGDSIAIAAETSPSGRGVSVTLFDADDHLPPLAEASSDAPSGATLAARVTTTGIHFVRIQVDDELDTAARRYRMSIAGPRRVREAGAAGGRRGDFVDLPLWHPHHEAVMSVVDAGLMTGRLVGDDRTFGPDRPVWGPELVQIVGSCLERLGKDPNGRLETWAQGSGTESGEDDAHLNGEVSRSRVLALIVGLFHHAFPALLARPTPVDPEATATPEESPETWRPIAEYNGLLAGLDGFAADADLTSAASRGEVAQLLHSMLQLVDDSPARRRGGGARAIVSAAAEPTPEWGSYEDLTDDFIHGANEALDSLIGAHVPAEVPLDGVPDIDAHELRMAVEAMRQRHQDRISESPVVPPSNPEPTNGSARRTPHGSGDPEAEGSGDPGADGSPTAAQNGARAAGHNGTRDPVSTRTTSTGSPLRSLRRHNRPAPARFKTRR